MHGAPHEPRWHVEGAYNPSDRGSNAGGEHIVLDEPLRAGRLVRSAGDPLCKPRGKFWGLTGPVVRTANCHHCIRQALRLGMKFHARATLDFGRSWSVILFFDQGRPTQLHLRSRWFRSPPPVLPTTPSEEALLRAVRAVDPGATKVTLGPMKAIGPGEVEGEAGVE